MLGRGAGSGSDRLLPLAEHPPTGTSEVAPTASHGSRGRATKRSTQRGVHRTGHDLELRGRGGRPLVDLGHRRLQLPEGGGGLLLDGSQLGSRLLTGRGQLVLEVADRGPMLGLALQRAAAPVSNLLAQLLLALACSAWNCASRSWRRSIACLTLVGVSLGHRPVEDQATHPALVSRGLHAAG